jgi:hypothetical protein
LAGLAAAHALGLGGAASGLMHFAIAAGYANTACASGGASTAASGAGRAVEEHTPAGWQV